MPTVSIIDVVKPRQPWYADLMTRYHSADITTVMTDHHKLQVSHGTQT
jgi:hypothetical protein